jgi:Tfp pilus assembly protein PilF
MNKIIAIFFCLWIFCGCEKLEESPLILAPNSEPSAVQNNDRGLENFQKREYFDAMLNFNQAQEADFSSGEVHFNFALALHMLNKGKRAQEQFELAKKYAEGNPLILESKLLNKYLGK